MPIPKAAVGDEFACSFQYLIIFKGSPDSLFIDNNLFFPAYTPLLREGEVYLGEEDLKRIYAPYLTIAREGGGIQMEMNHPLRLQAKVTLAEEDHYEEDGVLYLAEASVMSRYFDRQILDDPMKTVIAIDSEKPVAEGIPGWRPYKELQDRLGMRTYGEQNYCLWIPGMDRLINYRMYIPFSYREGTPHKTIVCFHGGDANANYMFDLTNHEIEEYAERYGYVLLALTSYRKYTFFGGNRLPASGLPFDPADPNPAGLTEEEMEWQEIAERSVMLQIKDAGKRYTLDEKAMYAIGNSGGGFGIYNQLLTGPRGLFRAVSISGGMPDVKVLDPEAIRSSGTAILVLMGSEDVFDGQYCFRMGYPWLQENRIPSEFVAVGGGEHLTAWTHALDQIFGFFERH